MIRLLRWLIYLLFGGGTEQPYDYDDDGYNPRYKDNQEDTK